MAFASFSYISLPSLPYFNDVLSSRAALYYITYAGCITHENCFCLYLHKNVMASLTEKTTQS